MGLQTIHHFAITLLFVYEGVYGIILPYTTQKTADINNAIQATIDVATIPGPAEVTALFNTIASTPPNAGFARLCAEGIFCSKTITENILLPPTPSEKKKAVVISSHQGNGFVGAVAAEGLAAEGFDVILILLPLPDGSHGNAGFMPVNSSNYNFDLLEPLLGNKVYSSTKKVKVETFLLKSDLINHPKLNKAQQLLGASLPPAIIGQNPQATLAAQFIAELLTDKLTALTLLNSNGQYNTADDTILFVEAVSGSGYVLDSYATVLTKVVLNLLRGAQAAGRIVVSIDVPLAFGSGGFFTNWLTTDNDQEVALNFAPKYFITSVITKDLLDRMANNPLPQLFDSAKTVVFAAEPMNLGKMFGVPQAALPFTNSDLRMKKLGDSDCVTPFSLTLATGQKEPPRMNCIRVAAFDLVD